MTKEQIEMYMTDNCLYQEEIDSFLSFTEEEQQSFYKRAEERLSELSRNTIKIPIEIQSKIIAIAYCDELDSVDIQEIESTLYERESWYLEAKRFFEKPESQKIVNEWGILQTNEKGEYQISDELIEELIEKEGMNLSNTEKDLAKKIIEDLWTDKSKFMTNDELSKKSIASYGIGFKEFLFCEEYLRTGRIKTTSESLGIGRTTCYDYLKKDEVKKYLEDRKKEITKESDNLLERGFKECFLKLQRIATQDSFISTTEQIKAIDTFLKHYEIGILRDKENRE